MEKYLRNMLGLKVKDKVTNFQGVITSISFDLYGCVQGLLTPGVDKDGKANDSRWFDMGRLKIIDTKPVMKSPNFKDFLSNGPEDKPIPCN